MYTILINTNKYIWMYWYVTRWSPEFLWFYNALILPIIYCIYLIDSCFYLNLYLLLFLDVYCIYFICALSQSSQSKDLFIAFWRMRSVSSFISSSVVGGDERACTRWCQGAQTVRTGGKRRKEKGETEWNRFWNRNNNNWRKYSKYQTILKLESGLRAF